MQIVKECRITVNSTQFQFQCYLKCQLKTLLCQDTLNIPRKMRNREKYCRSQGKIWKSTIKEVQHSSTKNLSLITSLPPTQTLQYWEIPGFIQDPAWWCGLAFEVHLLSRFGDNPGFLVTNTLIYRLEIVPLTLQCSLSAPRLQLLLCCCRWSSTWQQIKRCFSPPAVKD